MSAPYDDEFTADTLDPKWTWTRENVGKWSLTAAPDQLRIISQNNEDIHQNTGGASSDDAPLLLQSAPNGNFTIETLVTADPTGRHQQGGLVIYGDDDNYIRLTYGQFGASNPGVTGFEFGKEINAVFDPSATADRPTTDLTWYLRIVRCGQTYHGYYSLDGVTYTLIGTHRGTTFTVTHFGLTAFNGQGLTPGEKNFDFDFFHADYPGTASPCSQQIIMRI